MRTAILDAARIATPQQLHAALATQLSLPDDYGRNLDALFDVLTASGRPLTIVLRGRAELERQLGDYYVRFLRMLSDVNRQGPEARVTLALAPEELLPAEE